MRRFQLLVPTVSLIASGCAYPLDACGQPSRETWVSGTLLDSTGALVARASVMLGEVRYGRPPAGLAVGVIGPSTPENYGGPLQDRIVSARLEAPDGRVLFDLPIRFAESSGLFAPFDTVLADPREADALGRILLTRRAVVHMETRPPTPGPGRIVLDRVERGDREFSRARCS